MIQVAIVGCGEVGVAYAEGLRGLETAPTVHLVDPSPAPASIAFAAEAGMCIHPEPERWIAGVDIVLLTTPGGLLDQVLETVLPRVSEGCKIADLSTATPEGKHSAAARCADRGVDYVDVAITGAVALTKWATPLLYAGPYVASLVSIFEQLDAPLTVFKGAQPGDAVRVKLLRSVIMKGLEGLAVECFPAAHEYGVLDQLLASLGDVDRTGFVALLQAMTRTHAQHAGRREQEVAQAAMQLETIGYSSVMTRATEGRFATTNAAMAGQRGHEPPTSEASIAWLATLELPSGARPASPEHLPLPQSETPHVENP